MDYDEDESQPTQQATQNVLDPRRVGKQNSGFSDKDISDILCVLHPTSIAARREVERIARSGISGSGGSHIIGGLDADRLDEVDYESDDDNTTASQFAARNQPGQRPRPGDYALVLRLSAAVKNPLQGFTFGRNISRCDVVFDDPVRRLSNIHFRIYVNEYGVVMLEDQSTNGTVVDDKLLKARLKEHAPAAATAAAGETVKALAPDTKRTLSSGSRISILMQVKDQDYNFIVRIPRREGEYERAYRRNLADYLARLKGDEADRTIAPGPGGRVDLFPPPGVGRRFDDRDADGPAAAAGGDERRGLDAPAGDEDGVSSEWFGSRKYSRTSVIGKGAFATVYKVTSRYDGNPYAAKELEKRRFMKNGVLDVKVENEMKIMQNLEHPSIVRYVEHFEWERRLLIIIMEYVALGDLGRRISERGAIAESVVKTIAEQMLSALGYLHEKNITHRDIKPENILISKWNPPIVKLTDFGLSKMVGDGTFLRTFCGTLLYCAPEVYSEYSDYDPYTRQRQPRRGARRPPAGQRYDHAIDVWSLGGVLFYCLTGVPPYPVGAGTSYSELLHQIMTTDLGLEPLTTAGISNECIHFLQRMLNIRPEARATIAELKLHPWITGVPFLSRVGDSADEISDHELEQSASQLRLDETRDGALAHQDQDEETDWEEAVNQSILLDYLSDGDESEKENYTHTEKTQGRPRLFGEVSNIGSSGVINETRLNLPITDSQYADSQLMVPDSYESEESLMERQQQQRQQQKRQQQKRQQQKRKAPVPPSAVPSVLSRSDSQIRSLAADVRSQSLGGSESAIDDDSIGGGDLNMASAVVSPRRAHPAFPAEFTTSKRKPASDDSQDSYDGDHDGNGGGGASSRPHVKRLRSEARLDSLAAEDVEQVSLLASIPAIQAESVRQINRPVKKSSWWEPDRRTWHLNYPEMTQLQHDAFVAAARSRGEEFGPSNPSLWRLAMKYFPPSQDRPLGEEDGATTANSRTMSLRRGLARDDRKVSEASAGAGNTTLDTMPGTPDNDSVTGLPYSSQSSESQPRPVAMLTSLPTSVIQGVNVHVTEPVTTWGRAQDNTEPYRGANDGIVPKYGLRIVLWADGHDPLTGPLRPWETATNGAGTPQPQQYHYQHFDKENSPPLRRASSASSTSSPFAFYASTRARAGVVVNGQLQLPSHDSRNSKAPLRHWVRLHDGDVLTICGDPAQPDKAGQLLFSCAWGASASPRAIAEDTTPGKGAAAPPPTPSLEPDAVAARLDRAARVAESRVEAARLQDLASRDVRARARAGLDTERARSRAFEVARVDAIIRLSQQHSDGGSTGQGAAAGTFGPGTGDAAAVGLGGGGGYGAAFGPAATGAGLAAAAGRVVPVLSRWSPNSAAPTSQGYTSQGYGRGAN